MDNYKELKNLIGEENVSRETFSQLEEYIIALQKWNKKINLIGRSTTKDIWTRHIFDCAQVINYIPKDARNIIDMGCGAGLPGIIISILKPHLEVNLVESDLKKNAFLTEMKSKLQNNNIFIHPSRIEAMEAFKSDIITCRALASVNQLFELSYELIKKNKICIFLKGQNVVEEIEEANIYWDFEYKIHPSSLGNGYILEIQNVQRRD